MRKTKNKKQKKSKNLKKTKKISNFKKTRKNMNNNLYLKHKKTRNAGYLGLFNDNKTGQTIFTLNTAVGSFMIMIDNNQCKVSFTVHVFKHLDSFVDFDFELMNKYNTDNSMYQNGTVLHGNLFVDFVKQKLIDMQLTLNDFKTATDHSTFYKLEKNNQHGESITIKYTTKNPTRYPDKRTVDKITSYEFKLVSIYPSKKHDFTVEKLPKFYIDRQLAQQKLSAESSEKQDKLNSNIKIAIENGKKEAEQSRSIIEQEIEAKRQEKLSIELSSQNNKYNEFLLENNDIPKFGVKLFNIGCNRDNFNKTKENMGFVCKYLDLPDKAKEINGITGCVDYNAWVRKNKNIKDVLKNLNKSNKKNEDTKKSKPETMDTEESNNPATNESKPPTVNMEDFVVGRCNHDGCSCSNYTDNNYGVCVCGHNSMVHYQLIVSK